MTNANRTVAAILALVLLASAVAPAAAAPGDECSNADRGPSGDSGPPGFVGGIVSGAAGFLSDLFASLPVPNFVKGFFGAPTC